MPNVIEIDAKTAKDWVDAGQVVLVDVREDQELAAASITGAVHVPMSKFDPELVPTGDDGKKVVFFCAHGMRSYQVADYLLQNQMLGEAYSMTGGIVAWAGAGLPYEQG
ncbi:MAG: rhodanese-like domain-containing protein [Proteobacteria bacterium]|nr:rhodanese-like domain-containing protein [Pseudomonadota bacterium]